MDPHGQHQRAGDLSQRPQHGLVVADLADVAVDEDHPSCSDQEPEHDQPAEVRLGEEDDQRDGEDDERDELLDAHCPSWGSRCGSAPAPQV